MDEQKAEARWGRSPQGPRPAAVGRPRRRPGGWRRTGTGVVWEERQFWARVSLRVRLRDRGVRRVSGWLPSAVTVGVSAVEAWEARAKDF